MYSADMSKLQALINAVNSWATTVTNNGGTLLRVDVEFGTEIPPVVLYWDSAVNDWIIDTGPAS